MDRFQRRHGSTWLFFALRNSISLKWPIFSLDCTDFSRPVLIGLTFTRYYSTVVRTIINSLYLFLIFTHLVVNHFIIVWTIRGQVCTMLYLVGPYLIQSEQISRHYLQINLDIFIVHICLSNSSDRLFSRQR